MGPTAKRDRERDPFSELHIDHASHHKKIRLWWSNPTKYKTKLSLEQQKHSGRCLYHLTKSHSTVDCQVEKECDRVLAAARRSNSGTAVSSDYISNMSNAGQLRHLTEEVFKDAVEQDKADSYDDTTNDTNEVDLLYFARVSNHYL
jgi:hypothetical protein